MRLQELDSETRLVGHDVFLYLEREGLVDPSSAAKVKEMRDESYYLLSQAESRWRSIQPGEVIGHRTPGGGYSSSGKAAEAERLDVESSVMSFRAADLERQIAIEGMDRLAGHEGADQAVKLKELVSEQRNLESSLSWFTTSGLKDLIFIPSFLLLLVAAGLSVYGTYALIADLVWGRDL